MLMTVKAAADHLDTSVATIYRCIHAGAPCRRIGPTGKQYRVDPDQLLDWMDQITHTDEAVIDIAKMQAQRRAMFG